MMLVDANLLIYAVDRNSAHHAAARMWMEKVLSETTQVGLAWIALLAFLRITTHPRIMRNPLSPDAALNYVDEWLAQPCVVSVAPGEHHWPILRQLISASGTAANLTIGRTLRRAGDRTRLLRVFNGSRFQAFFRIKACEPIGLRACRT